MEAQKKNPKHRRNVEPYKDKILQMRAERISAKDILKYLKEEHSLDISPGTLSKRLIEWGAIKKKGGKTRRWVLTPYKEQFLEWNHEGHSITQMATLFEKKFDASTTEHHIRSYLDQWLNPHDPIWRKIDARPDKPVLSIPALPVDLLSAVEQQTLEEGIIANYLAEGKWRTIWQKILVTAETSLILQCPAGSRTQRLILIMAVSFLRACARLTLIMGSKEAPV